MTWCDATWCWVDANCERPAEKSAFFPDVLVNGEQLTYSYATCGNLNYYLTGSPELRTFPRRLRVSWATINSSTGFTKVDAAEGQGVKDSLGFDTKTTGAIVQFMSDIFAFYNIQWEFKPISAESNAYSASGVTNCIHEVALNRTDMCWFDSWLTEPRLEMTTMIALFEDNFKVMVRKSGSESVSIPTMLAVPFLPFSAELWMVIIGQYIFCSLIMYVLRGATMRTTFPTAPSRGG
mmetsp:Transcript_35815/g.83845  ORF Transcript_35815/g.83845 Transcript_35815/m.83845 type:complete len:236 (-) Transcript_35815:1686-2393(-)